MVSVRRGVGRVAAGQVILLSHAGLNAGELKVASTVETGVVELFQGFLTFVHGVVMDVDIFFSGCLGGIAAELMRVYRLKVEIRHPIKDKKFAIGISLAFIILAGLYASRILQVTNHYNAFITGLTLPITLAALLGEASPRPPVLNRAEQPPMSEDNDSV